MSMSLWPFLKLYKLFNVANSGLKATRKAYNVALPSYMVGTAIYSKVTSQPISLRDRVVFITGAANGIGKKVATLLAKEGAKVCIADINIKQAEITANELIKENLQVIAVQCDVSSVDSIKKAADFVRQKFGEPFLLINNAGIVSGKPILETQISDIERTFKVNVLSNFYTIKEFLPAMMMRNEGIIVTIASLAGSVGTSKMTDYSSSKFAVFGLNESLRNELKSTNSKVKTICINPYYIDTGMFKGIKTLLPMLKEDDVCERIVTAIKYGESVVYLPDILKYTGAIKSILTTDHFDKLLKFLKFNQAMNTFQGREKL